MAPSVSERCRICGSQIRASQAKCLVCGTFVHTKVKPPKRSWLADIGQAIAGLLEIFPPQGLLILALVLGFLYVFVSTITKSVICGGC